MDIDQIVGKVIDTFVRKRQLEKRLKAAQKILREDKKADKGEGSAKFIFNCLFHPMISIFRTAGCARVGYGSFRNLLDEHAY